MVLVLCGAGAWLTGWLPLRRASVDGSAASARQLEAQAWQRIWLTLLPAAIALATMFGWALQEPGVTDEPLLPTAALFALPVGALWLRSGFRAWRALRRPPDMPPIATVGLLRPRTLVEEGVDCALDPDAMEAAIAHEDAHRRHRDPLRIWLAQIATDIQWPSPHARRRLDDWLTSLELARDEEARIAGASGEDLAAALIHVVRMPRASRPAAMVGLTGADLAFASRVRRLLAPLPVETNRRSSLLVFALSAVLLAAVLVGVNYGDYVLRAMPFIGG
jgi:hypothetical protein